MNSRLADVVAVDVGLVVVGEVHGALARAVLAGHGAGNQCQERKGKDSHGCAVCEAACEKGGGEKALFSLAALCVVAARQNACIQASARHFCFCGLRACTARHTARHTHLHGDLSQHTRACDPRLLSMSPLSPISLQVATHLLFSPMPSTCRQRGSSQQTLHSTIN